jgi:hypothetical protein
MTTINIKESYGRNSFEVNGRWIGTTFRFVSIEKVRPGKWVGKDYDGNDFEIFGGKHAGAAANEWAVIYPEHLGDRPVWVNSAAAAVRVLMSI